MKSEQSPRFGILIFVFFQMSIYAPLYVINSHVKSAEFAPNYSSVHTNNSDVSCQFLTTTMNQISVWDSLQESAPVQQYKVFSILLKK